jgi:hypothetical protein
MKKYLQVLSRFNVLLHKGTPFISLFLWHPGESKSGQIHNIKGIAILLTDNVIAISKLLFSTWNVIHSEKIELLGLSWSFACVSQRLSIRDLYAKE